ncbi:MAG TPA: M13-type metalloendopeptidase [Thermoanaerobaculia bacterium]|nr:M13-type metalloendopeptidase [Thermoanaerobaculia bacterium]
MIAKQFAAAAALLVAVSVSGADKGENIAAKRFGAWGIDVEGMDRSVKPGDDFVAYSSGKWASSTEIPADKVAYNSFNILGDLSEARVRSIIERWAADETLKAGSDEAKVAAMYRSFMDEATAEKLDAKPIQPRLESLAKVTSHEELAKWIARSATSFSRTPFGAYVYDDAKDPDRYALYLGQAGLGLPDRDYYLRDNFKGHKERYQQYIADMLKLVSYPDAEKHAADIVAMETKIAEGHWSRAESRNRDKTYNPMTIAELEKYAPGYPWRSAFNEAGLGKVQKIVVQQNTALPKIAAVYAATPIETLKAWQAFAVADNAAPLLSSRFADTSFEFRAKFLSGAKEQRPRWKRAISWADGALGEAIGRTYVAEYFPADSKVKMEKLVSNLLAAMKIRINNLDWMSADTKKEALAKLANFKVKIGHPSKWRDYSALTIKDGDLVGNVERTNRFEWEFDVARIGKPVDKEEWAMTPHTVNAYYSPVKNEIVFPAAVLQPPFFDPQADPAVNYGAIGSGIGHEITHGFDDQGRKGDGKGVLRDWWTAEDAAKFEAQAAKLAAQYEGIQFKQGDDFKLIGKLSAGENIGDLGGLMVAHEAYKLSLGGKPAPVIDGFTGDQRFFLAYAQVWRSLYRDEALRRQLTTGPHSPGFIRAYAPLRNIDAWYEAFGVKEGDKLYVKPEDRVRIW